MKTTAILSAAFLGASIFTTGALAQGADVPGSTAQRELMNAQERNDVANDPAMGSAPSVQPESETMVPGNTAQRELKDAEERNSVAAGDDAMATGAVTNDMATDSDVLVPGSGATFSPGEAPTTQEGEALQDESPASQTQ